MNQRQTCKIHSLPLKDDSCIVCESVKKLSKVKEEVNLNDIHYNELLRSIEELHVFFSEENVVLKNKIEKIDRDTAAQLPVLKSEKEILNKENLLEKQYEIYEDALKNAKSEIEKLVDDKFALYFLQTYSNEEGFSIVFNAEFKQQMKHSSGKFKRLVVPFLWLLMGRIYKPYIKNALSRLSNRDNLEGAYANDKELVKRELIDAHKKMVDKVTSDAKDILERKLREIQDRMNNIAMKSFSDLRIVAYICVGMGALIFAGVVFFLLYQATKESSSVPVYVFGLIIPSLFLILLGKNIFTSNMRHLPGRKDEKIDKNLLNKLLNIFSKKNNYDAS